MGKSASVTMGKGSINHNNRVFIYKNVDPSLTPQNVILVQKDLHTAYGDIFGNALAQYNQKQKRNDRKISDYLSHIQKSKNGEKPFYEIIIQVGDRYNSGIGTPDAEIAKTILTEYYREFVLRNPNMIVFNAVIHMDEPQGTPHLHLDFIPVARGQTRGLETKNSLTQALKQQGFDCTPTPDSPQDPDTPYHRKSIPRFAGSRWLDSERAELGKLLEQHGIEWDKQNVHRKHLSIPEYKACAEIVQKIVRETSPVNLEIRAPNSAMRLAGIKANEVIISQDALTSIQKENQTLRAESKIIQDTLHYMDQEKANTDTFVRQTLKAAEARELRTKEQYSAGTEAEYKKLFGVYIQTTKQNESLMRACRAAAAANQALEANHRKQLTDAVASATAPLQAETERLSAELKSWQTKASELQKSILTLCRYVGDMVRALLTLKCDYPDQITNPYKSNLTTRASILIDTLARKAHAIMHQAGLPEFTHSLNSARIAADIESEIKAALPVPRKKSHTLER